MSLFEENSYCQQCKGICRGKDFAETQRNAHEKFGITPNNCVPNCNGYSRCPYEKNNLLLRESC